MRKTKFYQILTATFLATMLLSLSLPTTAEAFDMGACVVVSKSNQRSPAASKLKDFQPGTLAKVVGIKKGRLQVARNNSWASNSFSDCANSTKKSKFDHKAWIEKSQFESVYLWDELKLENAKDKGTYSHVYKSKFLEIHFDNETLEATLFSYGNRTLFKGRPETFQVFVTGLEDYPLMIRTAELDQTGTEIVLAGKSNTLSLDFTSSYNENNSRSGGISIDSISSKGLRYKSQWNCLESRFDLVLKENRLVQSDQKIKIKPKESATVQFRAPFQISEKYQALPGDRLKVVGFDQGQDKVQVIVTPSSPKEGLSEADLTTYMSYSQLYTHVSADYSCS